MTNVEEYTRMVKRSIKKLCGALLVVLVLAFALALAACSGGAYKVSFMVDGTEYSSVMTDGGEEIELPAMPEKEGSTFDGWYWDEGTWQRPFTETSLENELLSGDLSVYAKWIDSGNLQGTDASFAHFDAMGVGAYSIKVSNATESLPMGGFVAVAPGASWVLSSDSAGSNVIEDKTAALEVGDNTFYAVVTSAEGQVRAYTLNIRRRAIYTVTFNEAGGLVCAAQQVEEDSYAVEPETERLGYTFMGWGFDFLNTPVTSDLTLTAEWELNEYTVTYNLNGGTNAAENPASYTVEDGTVSLSAPTRKGYDFDGWYDNSSFSGTRYWSIQAGSADDIAFWAKWTAKEIKATLANFDSELTADVWDGTTASSFADGTGTADDPYIIETAEQLAYFGSRVNSGDSFNGEYILLQRNIDLNRLPWTPIGMNDAQFQGFFDGGGHTVSGLYYSSEPMFVLYIGFFGRVSDATIVNLSLKDIEINVTGGVELSSISNIYLGGLVGYGLGECVISKCCVQGNILYDNRASTLSAICVGGLGGCFGDSGHLSIDNCYARIDFDLYSDLGEIYCGGLIGYSSSQEDDINASYFEGNIRSSGGNSSIAAGIIGFSKNGSISDCFAVGDIAAERGTCYTDAICARERNDCSVKFCYQATVLTERSQIVATTYGVYIPKETLQETEWIVTNLGWDFDETWIEGETYPELPVSVRIIEEVEEFVYYDDSNYELEVPVHPGYTFGGWFDGEGGTGTQYADGNGEAVRAWDKDADTTLYPKWTANTYTVTFDKGDGTGGSDSVTATFDSAMPAAEAPYITGYTFEGYFTEDGVQYYDGTMTSVCDWDIASDTTLYAQWTHTVYTITFDHQGGSGADPVTLYYGDALPVVATVPTRLGYTFLGYFDEADGGNMWYSAEMALVREGNYDREADTTLYAHWQANTYMVMFNAGAGSGAHFRVTATFGEEMPALDPPAPVPNGELLLFAGYFDSPTGGTMYYDAELQSAHVWDKASDTTLFARYVGIPYYIEFDVNGGEGAMDTQEFAYYEAEALTPNAFTRVGYEFDCWNTSADGTGTAYEDGAEILNLTDVQGTTITLYAQWTPKEYTVILRGENVIPQYTVSFDLNGAEGTAPAAQTVTNTQGLSYPETDPAREGYVFVGWYDNADCTGTPFDFSADVTADVTLYAKWLTYNSSVEKILYAGENTIKIVGGSTRQHFVFFAKVTETVTFNVGKNAWIFVNDTYNNTNGNTYGTLTKDCTAGTIYYIGIESEKRNTGSSYVGETYLNITASQPADGGMVIADWSGSGTVTYDSSFTLTVPVKNGYEFLGWYDAEDVQYTDGTGASVKAWDKDEESAVLYAKWAPIEYSITYELDGGENHADNPVTYTIESSEIVLGAPTKEGYSFIGWTTDGVDTPAKELTIPAGSFGSITLTAHWVEYGLNEIEFDADQKAVKYSDFDNLTAELFGATCTDTDGESIAITVAYTGDFEIGKTITVTLTATVGAHTQTATIENVRIYGVPTIEIENTSITLTHANSFNADTFDAIAYDSFGESLTLNISGPETPSPITEGGLYVFTFTATDAAGNTAQVPKEIRVYAADDIVFHMNDVVAIKESSRGEEFEVSAVDTFGEPCEDVVFVVSGVLTAGTTARISFMATDKAGNRVNSDEITVRVYGAPTAYMAVRELTADTPAADAYIVLDTFGEEIPATVTYGGALVAGSNVTVSVSATDAAGNRLTASYTVPVYCGEFDHRVSNCVCDVCGKEVHTPGSDCLCQICGEEAHTIGDDCICTVCGQAFHEFHQGICVYCGSENIDVWDGTVASGFAGGSGTEGDPYIIETGAQLAYLASRVNSGYTYSGNYFRLDKDIDLTGIDWTPIGYSTSRYFRGTFDGNGHTIYGLTITKNRAYAGLFGSTYGATIKNVALRDVNIEIRYSEFNHAGGIVGYAGSNTSYITTISNCSTEGRILGGQSSSTAFVGGILGYGNASISNSYCVGEVLAGSNSERCYAGGIVGGLHRKITIDSCYFSGRISAESGDTDGVYAAGILGVTNSSMSLCSISNCFATGDFSVDGSNSSTEYTNAIYNPFQGSYSLSVSNNYYADVTLTEGSAVVSTTGYGTEIDAENFASVEWLENTLGWDMDTVWTVSDNLPVLRIFQ